MIVHTDHPFRGFLFFLLVKVMTVHLCSTGNKSSLDFATTSVFKCNWKKKSSSANKWEIFRNYFRRRFCWHSSVTFSGKLHWLSPFLIMNWSCSPHFYLRKGEFWKVAVWKSIIYSYGRFPGNFLKFFRALFLTIDYCN